MIDRYDQGRFYWELRACTYWKEFEAPKIVSTKVSIRPTFVLDDSGSFLANTAYFFDARNDGLYLLGLLNSRVFHAYAKLVFVEKQNGWYEVQPAALEAFPIPTATPDEQAICARLVEYISCLARATADRRGATSSPEYRARSGLECVLDGLVYEIYFGDDLGAAGHRLFDLLAEMRLPTVSSIPKSEKIARLHVLAATICSNGQPIQRLLEQYSSAPLVRAVESYSGASAASFNDT